MFRLTNGGIFWMVDRSFGLADGMSFRRVADGIECANGHSAFVQFTSNLQGGCRKKQDEPNLQFGNCLRAEERARVSD